MEDAPRTHLTPSERVALIRPRVERIDALSNNQKKKVLGEFGWPDYKRLQQQRADGAIDDARYWDDMSDILHNNGIEDIDTIDARIAHGSKPLHTSGQ
jgi:hypothetical protein